MSDNKSHNAEASQLKTMYDKLKVCGSTGEDCTEILQNIIDYSFNHSISETELKRHLA